MSLTKDKTTSAKHIWMVFTVIRVVPSPLLNIFFELFESDRTRNTPVTIRSSLTTLKYAQQTLSH